MSVNLWSMLLGSGVTLLGGFLAPTWSHRLTKKADWSKLRKEKLEEVLGLLYEHDHWLDLVRYNAMSRDQYGPSPLEPLPRARAIAALYFPELNKCFMELGIVSSDYIVWILDEALGKHDGNRLIKSDGFEEAYDPYRAKFDDVVEKLKSYDVSKF